MSDPNEDVTARRIMMENLNSAEHLERIIMDAAHSVELALTRAHAFRTSTPLRWAVARLGIDAAHLLETFGMPSLNRQQSKALLEECRES